MKFHAAMLDRAYFLQFVTQRFANRLVFAVVERVAVKAMRKQNLQPTQVE